MSFPVHRPRRLRKTKVLRSMLQETRLHPSDFVYPLFVVEGRDIETPIASMPGINRLSRENVVKEAAAAFKEGVPAILLFGVPDKKDAVGSEAYNQAGVIQKTVRAVKDTCPDIIVITDVCLCEYTDHGHCGLLKKGDVDNDSTLQLLGRTAVSHALAGADIIAPSDMMDGRVGVIREHLDAAGFPELPIMSYAAKYASAFYGPFRDAADSTPQMGDRKSYQMDPYNAREALREVALDIDEGADIVMVKPALAYLDVIYQVRHSFDTPVAAYNVSGEYSMLKAAVEKGWMDEAAVRLEMLLSIKRAGADIIISYFAREICRELQGV